MYNPTQRLKKYCVIKSHLRRLYNYGTCGKNTQFPFFRFRSDTAVTIDRHSWSFRSRVVWTARTVVNSITCKNESKRALFHEHGIFSTSPPPTTRRVTVFSPSILKPPNMVMSKLPPPRKRFDDRTAVTDTREPVFSFRCILFPGQRRFSGKKHTIHHGRLIVTVQVRFCRQIRHEHTRSLYGVGDVCLITIMFRLNRRIGNFNVIKRTEYTVCRWVMHRRLRVQFSQVPTETYPGRSNNVRSLMQTGKTVQSIFITTSLVQPPLHPDTQKC